MSNVNDNNLDDLLRRAADKYPLRTDGADFSKLVADLEEDPSLILPPVTEDRRRRRRFLWLLLLLPLAGGAYFAWHAAKPAEAPAQGIVSPKSGVDAAAGNNGGNAGTERAGEAKGDIGTERTGEAKGNIGKERAGEVKENEGNAAGPGKGKEIGGLAGDGKKKEIGGLTDSGKEKAIGGEVAVGDKKSETGRIPGGGKERASAGVVGARQKAAGKGTSGGGEEQPSGELVAGDNQRVSGETARAANARGGAGVNGADKSPAGNDVTPGRDRSGVGNKASLAPIDRTVNVHIPVTVRTVSPLRKHLETKEKTRVQIPKHSFYVGILGSPDLSMIRFQSVKSVGDNIGVLFGYTLNSRWSIETGLSYDRKKYYTSGEHFSKSKLPGLSAVDLKEVEGGCNMWEIPLNARYNFRSEHGKMQWFATGGLSTYLMTKEVYTFYGDAWGNPNWYQTWPYKTPYKYWFSILNLSIGFEQRLGKIGNLRLEPFVRIPLSGIGTGSLNITSAGLNIGITRRIW